MIIQARSPFIVEVDEINQTASKVLLYIWNGYGSAPGSPTYTLQKNIPSATNTKTTYNISPFLKEYLSHISPASVTTPTTNNSNEWCQVQVRRYKIIGTTETLLDTTTYDVVDGYNLYTDGYNHDNGHALLTEGTYYYPLGESNIGSLLVRNDSGSASYVTVRWFNYVTNVNTQSTFSTKEWKDFPYVNAANVSAGNRLTVTKYATGGTILSSKEYHFRPINECFYTPVECDFINKLGGWQKTWFFKASNDSLSVENQGYNLLQANLVNYDVQEGQRKMFNTLGKKSIKVNTGYVSEEYNKVLQELMLSERILINGSPVVMNTKNTELFKNINTKLINYQLDFEFAYDYNTTVV